MANDEVFSSSSSGRSCSSGSSTRTGSGSSLSTPSTPRKTKYKTRKSSQEHDVVKQGYLHIKRPPNSKIRFKAWQKKFFILRDMSFDDGMSTLEMYDSESAYECTSPHVEYILDLKNVTNVDNYIESKRYPRAFMVLRSAQSPLVFGTTCDIDQSSWMEAIHVLAIKRKSFYSFRDLAGQERRSSLPAQIQFKANPLYTSMPPPTMPRECSVERPATPTRTDGPPTPPRNNSIQSNDSGNNINNFIATKCDGVLVRVQASSSSERHRLSGEYYMNVWPGCIALTTIQSLREKLRWSIEHITKFKSEDMKSGENLVTLEASVASGPAEGMYQFRTSHGLDLIKKVKAASCGGQHMVNNNKCHTPPPGHCPTPPPLERQMELLRKTSCTPQTPKASHLFPKLDRMKERSSSTPNLRECKGLQKLPPATVQRNVQVKATYESTTVERHGYLDLLDDDQNDSCFISSPDKEDILGVNGDLDFEVFPCHRDSGFSDTEDDEPGIYRLVPCPGSTSPSTTTGTKPVPQTESVLYTQVVTTTVDCRPPLPPKTTPRKNTLNDAFLDYDEEVKSLPEAPPVPVRHTKI